MYILTYENMTKEILMRHLILTCDWNVKLIYFTQNGLTLFSIIHIRGDNGMC